MGKIYVYDKKKSVLIVSIWRVFSIIEKVVISFREILSVSN